MIVEDSHVEQRTHGDPLRRFRKTVLRVPGEAPRFLVRKALPEGPSRRTPVLRDDREQAVYDVSTTLLATGRVAPPVYARGNAALGQRGMVELVGILGYYCMVALTLNTFELGIPGSIAAELNDPDFPGAGA